MHAAALDFGSFFSTSKWNACNFYYFFFAARFGSNHRLQLISEKKQIPGEYKFICSDGVGQRQMEWDRKFQACTCQFAAHYFFASRQTLRCFLTNVATALDEGGHFFGTIPDGKQILNVLQGQNLYDSGMLRVRRTWKGPFNSFGSFGAGYTFAIANTVTNVDKDSDDLGDG